MKGLLIHGCYDQKTLQTLLGQGVSQFSFDLRATSPNLIPYSSLKILLNNLIDERVFLTFENDKESTVLSFLDLLKSEPQNFFLQFRDTQPAKYYQKFNRPFVWMFNPEADWENILRSKNIMGVLLPVKFQDIYLTLPELWSVIETQELEIFLHAENFEEGSYLSLKTDIQISLDLGEEIEVGFRSVDQDCLKNKKFWRNLNEYPAR